MEVGRDGGPGLERCDDRGGDVEAVGGQAEGLDGPGGGGGGLAGLHVVAGGQVADQPGGQVQQRGVQPTHGRRLSAPAPTLVRGRDMESREEVVTINL